MPRVGLNLVQALDRVAELEEELLGCYRKLVQGWHQHPDTIAGWELRIAELEKTTGG